MDSEKFLKSIRKNVILLTSKESKDSLELIDVIADIAEMEDFSEFEEFQVKQPDLWKKLSFLQIEQAFWPGSDCEILILDLPKTPMDFLQDIIHKCLENFSVVRRVIIITVHSIELSSSEKEIVKIVHSYEELATELEGSIVEIKTLLKRAFEDVHKKD